MLLSFRLYETIKKVYIFDIIFTLSRISSSQVFTAHEEFIKNVSAYACQETI